MNHFPVSVNLKNK